MMDATGNVTRTAPITPQRAREALGAIAALVEPAPPDHWAIAALQTVLAQLDGVRDRKEVVQSARCSACREAHFTPLAATAHLGSCPRHPAITRALAVRSAVRLAPALHGALAPGPTRADPHRLAELDALAAREAPGTGPGGFGLPSRSDLARALERLGEPGPGQFAEAVKAAVRQLSEAVTCWERVFHRELDPCPFCGAVVPIGEIVGHLERCNRHPAAVIAAEAVEGLAAGLGKPGAELLVKLAIERAEQVDGLRKLLQGCRQFDADLGWNGSEAYAREYVERGLDDAMKGAGRCVEAKERGFHPPFDPVVEAASGPAFARPVWRALLAVGVAGPTPGSHGATAEEAALLEGAAAELRELHDRMGVDVECPACRRPGVWIERAVEHVASCLAQPAVQRRRGIAAELALAAAILKVKRPGGEEVEVDDERETGLRLVAPNASEADAAKRREAERQSLEYRLNSLEFLLSAEKRRKYPGLVRRYQDDLAGPLSDWQRHRVAAASECPFCGAGLPFAELLQHLGGCAHHPASRKAAVMEATLERIGVPRLGVASGLRAQADRARIATVRLLEYAEAFRGTWGEDERFRATIPRRAEPGWRLEMERAAASLKELEAARDGDRDEVTCLD